MTPEEFVKEFYILKTELIDTAFDVSSGREAAIRIAELSLDEKTRSQFKYIISTLLTDAFYTILLGLDGEAQIGVKQEPYKILDGKDRELTGGEIEAYAYEYFHGDSTN